jgi:uncharacterized membrane protein
MRAIWVPTSIALAVTAAGTDMQRPVHPALVHFPLALLMTSLLADAGYFFTALPPLRHAGFWMLAVACGTGAITVLAGLYDMRRAPLQEDVHQRVHRHMWIGLALYAVIGALTAWRWTIYSDPARQVTMLYLDAAFLASVLAAFQGWLGAELVYTHGVFVARGGGAADSNGSGGSAAEPPHQHKH